MKSGSGRAEQIAPEVRDEVERQLAVMREGAVELYGEEELRERLARSLVEKRPLRVKLGMDPSSPDLHLGHTVVLLKLRRFQELGHTPIFLIGDFTARIGDPSGRNKTRPALSEEDVKANAATYVDQVAKILDVERAEVRFNGEWMGRMTPPDFVKLCSHQTVARLLERDDFAKRHRAGVPISVHEFLYPFVQAYDSVALRSDVELGGTDQTFNLLMARDIQRDYGQPAQAVITHALLVGTDGHEKMSKSLGNAIGITDAPEDLYGKVMSIPDAQIATYVELLSAGEWEQRRDLWEAARRGEGNPMEAKLVLAGLLVARLHGATAADGAAEHFRRVVQRKEVPEEIAETALCLAGAADVGLLEALEKLELIASRSDGRRLVTQGAVQIDGVRVEDATRRLGEGSYLLRVGKRRFATLHVTR